MASESPHNPEAIPNIQKPSPNQKAHDVHKLSEAHNLLSASSPEPQNLSPQRPSTLNPKFPPVLNFLGFRAVRAQVVRVQGTGVTRL